MAEQLKKVDHSYIRYANCWEDADNLLQALQIENGDKVLSIASAGDNSFSLLINNPKVVVAVDINEVQLNLVELKKMAIKHLDHGHFMQFLGYRECQNRLTLFERLLPHLNDDLRLFWQGRQEEIRDGLISQGKFEKYFHSFRTKILPLIHSEKKVNRLLEKKSATEQKEFFDKEWNTFRWRWLFKFFFSRFVMGRLGRDPKFLKEVKISVSSYILSRAGETLSSVDCQSNYFLHKIFAGKFSNSLPHYVREENFQKIKANIDNLHTFHGLAEDAFIEYGTFNKFNLSNIFEYMKPPSFEKVSEDLVKNGSPKARYAYWNLMVPRRMSAKNENLAHENELSKTLTKKDKGFFYWQFILDVKS